MSLRFKVALGCMLALWLSVTTVISYRSLTRTVQTVVNPAVPDTVYLPADTVTRVIEEANHPKRPSLVERVTTTEVKPDTVYIARADTVYADLPDYGMQKVEKEDKKLTVTSLSRDGKESQKSVYSLPKEDSDYLLTSGVTPSTLRTKRTWDIVELEAKLLVAAGTNGVMGAAVGPVNVNVTPNLSASPAVVVDSEGWNLGVVIQLDF